MNKTMNKTMKKTMKKTLFSSVAFSTVLSGFMTPVLGKNYINDGDDSFDENFLDKSTLVFSTRKQGTS